MQNGFKAAAADPCLYIRDNGKTKVLLLVYVDNLLLASTDSTEIKMIEKRLNAEFELSNLGEVRHFLGVEVLCHGGVFKLSLGNYIDRLLKSHGMEEAKSAKSPMNLGYHKQAESEKTFDDPTSYRSLVGALLYLAVVTRPDIAASAAILGRRFSAPTEVDWMAAKRVLRFLKKTKGCYMQLGGIADQSLVGFSDANWAGDAESRRSTSGMVFQFGGGTNSWASRRQSSVTLSSMEAENIALSEACQEALWLRQLLRDFGEPQDQPTVVMEDNQSCLAFVRSDRTNRRSKHIDTLERFVQALCVEKKIVLQYCSTDRTAADIMTKPLGPLKHREFCELLGLKEDS
ncbi:uncharacterized protein LOC134290970 [Aedes albopictus]|uniref:Reverse transcriptase Ty1/copia-type domain-containing protein n=1 Tax=Aedes albopictus TaxID=7160 RepID=A0ABM1ZAB4_AEDAL